MRSSRTFTHAAAQDIRRLLGETRRSDSARQKRLRDQIRALEFYISDFRAGASGFTPEDFDQLLAQGTIRIVDGGRFG